MRLYMKVSLCFLFFFLIILPQKNFAQDNSNPDVPYEMKTYYMAFLKKGPNRNQDSTETQQIQKAHLQHINKMVEDKKVIIAGPFLDDGDIRGILIFNVETIEEAIALTEADPAVKAGRLIMEVRPWWGAKGSCLE
ncbi:MAG: hypothetical protein IPM56_17040 [Ignavibacteriales bacterium]|nr:MAG: hypothetical protein IPM56_17040 [Ignavibacteriales bacterium]